MDKVEGQRLEGSLSATSDSVAAVTPTASGYLIVSKNGRIFHAVAHRGTTELYFSELKTTRVPDAMDDSGE